jgi:hypothetical protein
MESISSSETFFSFRTTPRYSSEGCTPHFCWLLRLFFYSEDGSDMCLRNVMLLRTIWLNNPEDHTFSVHDLQISRSSVRELFESFQMQLLWNGVNLAYVFQAEVHNLRVSAALYETSKWSFWNRSATLVKNVTAAHSNNIVSSSRVSFFIFILGKILLLVYFYRNVSFL